MADLEQLERLVRLREAGALTEAEFEAQKLKLLEGEPARPAQGSLPGNLIAAGALAVTILVAAVLWNRDPSGSPSSQAAEQAAPGQASAAATGPVSPVAAANPASGSGDPLAATNRAALDFATSREVIGLNGAYLEQRLGIPREKREGALVFDVGGCRLSYSIDKGSVRAFSVEIDRACQPKIADAPVGPGTTFGQILGRQSGGELTASCLWSCGNAADPTIDLVYPGARYNQEIAIQYSTDYEQASGALDLWQQAGRKRLGIDYENEADFPYEVSHCVRNPPATLRPSLLRLKVRTVWVYLDDDGRSC